MLAVPLGICGIKYGLQNGINMKFLIYIWLCWIWNEYHLNHENEPGMKTNQKTWGNCTWYSTKQDKYCISRWIPYSIDNKWFKARFKGSTQKLKWHYISNLFGIRLFCGTWKGEILKIYWLHFSIIIRIITLNENENFKFQKGH